MEEIVIKFDLEQHDIRVYSPYLDEEDAVKILLAAFIRVTEELDEVTKKATFLAASECCRDELYSPKIEVIK